MYTINKYTYLRFVCDRPSVGRHFVCHTRDSLTRVEVNIISGARRAAFGHNRDIPHTRTTSRLTLVDGEECRAAIVCTDATVVASIKHEIYEVVYTVHFVYAGIANFHHDAAQVLLVIQCQI